MDSKFTLAIFFKYIAKSQISKSLLLFNSLIFYIINYQINYYVSSYNNIFIMHIEKKFGSQVAF